MHFLLLSAEIVDAEVARRVHAVVTVVGRGECALDAVHELEAGEVHVGPVLHNQALTIAEVSEVELHFAGRHLAQIALKREKEPVAFIKLLGIAVAFADRVNCISRVGDVCAGYVVEYT